MTYHTEVLADTPSVYWKMNQSAGINMSDSSGNFRDGTYSGTVGTSYVLAKPSLLATDSANTSVLFSNDGTDNPASPVAGGTGGGVLAYTTWNGMNVTGNVFSAEIWAKINPALSTKYGGTTGQPLFSRQRTAGSAQWELRAGNTTPQIICWGPTYGSLGQAIFTSFWPAERDNVDVGIAGGEFIAPSEISTIDISDGSPHYLCAVRNSGYSRLFVDAVGAPYYWNAGVEAIQSNTTEPLAVGRAGSSTTLGFIGYLSNAAFYLSALSPERIVAHYTAGVGHVAYINAKWTLNGAQGMALEDAVNATCGFGLLRNVSVLLQAAANAQSSIASRQSLGVTFADSASIVSQISTSQFLQWVLGNAVNVNAALGLSSVQQFSLDSIVMAGVVIRAGDDTYNGWIVNPTLGASVMLEGFGFNSLAPFRGQYYAAKDDGLYRLGGDTDAGAPILSYVALPKSSFGTAKMKRVPFAYIGAASNGTMVLRVIADGQQYNYAVRNPTTDMAEQRVDIGRGLKSNYWQFELINPDGADFSLDTIKFMPVILERRI